MMTQYLWAGTGVQTQKSLERAPSACDPEQAPVAEEAQPMATTNETTTVLVLRDAAGDFYALTEETIRTCRATTEQQAALEELTAGHEVAGYDAGSLVNIGAITVAPQLNTNIGLNVAAANFAPVTQVLGQTGITGFSFR
jgi:hypothetical protein